MFDDLEAAVSWGASGGATREKATRRISLKLVDRPRSSVALFATHAHIACITHAHTPSSFINRHHCLPRQLANLSLSPSTPTTDTAATTTITITSFQLRFCAAVFE
jgi:hypothetical protein